MDLQALPQNSRGAGDHFPHSKQKHRPNRRQCLWKRSRRSAVGWRLIVLWRVAEDISGDGEGAFLPSSSWHEDLWFQAVCNVSAASPRGRGLPEDPTERENCCVWRQDRHVVAIRAETWSTRWRWPQTDLGHGVFANTFMVCFTLSACWITETQCVTENVMD